MPYCFCWKYITLFPAVKEVWKSLKIWRLPTWVNDQFFGGGTVYIAKTWHLIGMFWGRNTLLGGDTSHPDAHIDVQYLPTNWRRDRPGVPYWRHVVISTTGFRRQSGRRPSGARSQLAAKCVHVMRLQDSASHGTRSRCLRRPHQGRIQNSEKGS